jgi:hypothetical protein
LLKEICLVLLDWLIKLIQSQLATILETHVTPPDTEPEASFIILDGSALINALPLRISKTFEEYAVLDVWFWLLLKEICLVLLDWLIKLILICI